MKIPFLALLFQGIPEDIALITFAFVIAKIPLQWKKIVGLAVMLALTSYIIRLFPVTFGIHTLFLMGLLFLFLVKIGKTNLNTSLITSLICILTIIILETICLSILMPLFGVTPEVFFSNITLRILLTLPQVLILFLLAFIIWKIRIRKNM